MRRYVACGFIFVSTLAMAVVKRPFSSDDIFVKYMYDCESNQVFITCAGDGVIRPNSGAIGVTLAHDFHRFSGCVTMVT